MEVWGDIMSGLMVALTGGVGWLVKYMITDRKERRVRQETHDKFEKDTQISLELINHHIDDQLKENVHIRTKLDFINDSLATNNLDTKRLELLNYLQHTPTNKALIHQLYDAYKAAGGNSYMDEVYQQWVKEGHI